MRSTPPHTGPVVSSGPFGRGPRTPSPLAGACSPHLLRPRFHTSCTQLLVPTWGTCSIPSPGIRGTGTALLPSSSAGLGAVRWTLNDTVAETYLPSHPLMNVEWKRHRSYLILDHLTSPLCLTCVLLPVPLVTFLTKEVRATCSLAVFSFQMDSECLSPGTGAYFSECFMSE